MLFTFKSAASANLIMHEASGREILALLGKNPEDACGIITVEQLPAAISTLHQAIARKPGDAAEASEVDGEPSVGLAQRAVPFIDMLERAARDGEPVVWGI